MANSELYNLQEEANRLIAQGLLTGSMTLENGRFVKLNDNQILRLISFVKSDKLTKQNVNLQSLVPDDFLLPDVPMMQVPEQHSIEQPEPDLPNNDKKLESNKSNKIDFDALERQINKNTNL